jgi:cellulose biosynthesis protein BcsQ
VGTYATATLAGSAGKTTTVVTTAVKLAQAGQRVRVIDTDSQGNATSWLGYKTAPGDARDLTGRPTIVDVLRENASIKDVEIPARRLLGYEDEEETKPVYEDIPNLTIVPAVRDTLDRLIVELPGITGGVLRLRDALAADGEPVDSTLLDCPGSLNALVIGGLIATSWDEDDDRPGAWGAITCTKPSGKENEGIPQLQLELQRIKKAYRLDIPLLSIVPCAVPGQGNVYPEQMGFLTEAFGERVTPMVRRASVVDTAYTNLVPLPLYGYDAKTINADYQKVIEHQQAHGLYLPRRTA